MISASDPEITILTSVSVFENTVFSVFSDHIIDKNGHEVERYLSVVPKCLLDGAVAGVAVLPVIDGEVGLIRIFRHPLGQASWEAIKGHVEPGEDVRLSAIRELQEEAGFSISQEELIDLGAVSPEAGVIKARTRLFAAIVSGKVASKVQGELGHGVLVFFKGQEIDNLIVNGEIEDASSLSLLLKYRTTKFTRVKL
jgi:ADP-ribose pyrophosphatase